METKESLNNVNSDYNRGYETGYHSKDYTWEDGIKYTSVSWPAESAEYKNGFTNGQRDRLRDEMDKWMC